MEANSNDQESIDRQLSEAAKEGAPIVFIDSVEDKEIFRGIAKAVNLLRNKCRHVMIFIYHWGGDHKRPIKWEPDEIGDSSVRGTIEVALNEHYGLPGEHFVVTTFGGNDDYPAYIITREFNSRVAG
ncbi:hypothetical protein A3I40_03105 [Candidatus Uhrbacteria bacterium RIFCSPLOWO2_02_FULL_48_12]|uniref:Uncharacterized protein n=1 Tax=Candidatus Uhrbacteria bacterium RIFCSPLOWO2_02_FULL_48_12 TaxID=1802407 RepID=A0A1F7V9R7_9BACT|nr:MAG: hypothetical protein A3I40_03105 [Candidatus Uhrbacteria bacterium RIFCSPLOWO2_02_FULL_48_12]